MEKMEMDIQEVNKKEVREINKHSHWWIDKKGNSKKKWAVQDKSGIWWLINGSEFPEKKLTNKELVSNKKRIVKKYDYSLIVLTCALGTSLAINLILILKIII